MKGESSMQASDEVPRSAHGLFVDFLESFLQIQFVGFQSTFGNGSDLILFSLAKYKHYACSFKRQCCSSPAPSLSPLCKRRSRNRTANSGLAVRNEESASAWLDKAEAGCLRNNRKAMERRRSRLVVGSHRPGETVLVLRAVSWPDSSPHQVVSSAELAADLFRIWAAARESEAEKPTEEAGEK
jgi:hypothetical protein